MINWDGKGKPDLPDDTRVRVWFRGDSRSYKCYVRNLGWGHFQDSGDIVAYEVLDDQLPLDAAGLGDSHEALTFGPLEEGTKNPKDALGSDKLPLHLWPNTATALGCIGMLNGRGKYGRSNFRATSVRASIYYDAAKRHLDAWFEGEECDQADGVPHLGAALSCIAIIVDAGAAGKLIDDRMVAGGYTAFVEQMTAHVPRLKKLHEGKDPKHYTIADSAEVAS